VTLQFLVVAMNECHRVVVEDVLDLPPPEAFEPCGPLEGAQRLVVRIGGPRVAVRNVHGREVGIGDRFGLVALSAAKIEFMNTPTPRLRIYFTCGVPLV